MRSPVLAAWLPLVLLPAFLFAAGPSFAAVTFRAASSAASAGGAGITYEGSGNARSARSGNVTPTLPGGIQAGDLLACLVESHDTVPHTTSAPGWTRLYMLIDSSGSGQAASLFYKIAGSSEANPTISHPGGNSIVARCSAFRGVDPAMPFDVPYAAAYSAADRTVETGSLTTTSCGALLLFALHVNDNPNGYTVTTTGGLAWTQAFYSPTGAGNDSAIGLFRADQPSPGAIGPLQATTANNQPQAESHGVLLALRPAASGLAINRPASTGAGDVMVSSVAVTPSTACITPPTGWTLVRQVTQGSATTSVLATYVRVTGPGEPASYTFTFSGAHSGAVAGIASFSGVDTSAPIDAEAGNATASDTNHAAPGVTTTLPDGMLVTVHELASAATWSPPAGMTEAVDVASRPPNDANGISMQMNYEPRPVAGATGARTASASANADRGAAQSVSLKPAPLVCFTDDFNRADGSPGTGWVVSSSSGAFGNPVIVNNRLRLTDASNNVATLATLQRLFPGAGNRIEVEFEHYAYGGSGADGITLTFSDSSIPPVPGGYGGSLGYAQRCGINGFAGGWLGVGIDEYGNFSNDNECRGDGPPPSALVPDSVSVRGSGSGTTGYRFHAGTGSLTPGVDNNGGASPPHKYRIIVDHSNAVNAFVSVERDTGSGYVTLIAPYDAKAQAGQAAVPASWTLSYTGSTGGATNVHEIDSLRICATAQTPIAALAYFEITVAASASTCVPHSVTITARDASNNVYAGYTGTITLSTSTGHGTWAKPTSGTIPQGPLTAGTDDGAATYTFVTADNGSIVLTLDNERAENLTITGVDVTVPASSSTTGVVSYLDNAFVITPTDALGTTAVAGRGHGMQAALWRCERVDPTTCNTCGIATAYTGDRSLDAWITRAVDDPGGAAPTMTGTEVLNGPVALPNAAPGADNLQLRFSNGVAPFNLGTADVGKYLLNLRDDSRTFASAIDIAGASATLTTRPFGLGFTQIRKGATPNPGGTASAGSPFVAAGDTFEATVSGYLWSGGDDGNNDGIPDAGTDVTDNGVTPSYAWNTALSASGSGYTPAGGAAGTLSGTSPIPGASFSGGSATVSDLSYSEVGSVLLSALAQDYLSTTGVNVTGTSGTVGRFYPAYFALTAGSITPGCGTFTYMDQPALGISYTVEAKNSGGGTTANYDVAKGYTHAGLGVVGLRAEDNDDGVDRTSRLSGMPSTNWVDGVYAAATASAAFGRAPGGPDGAFDNLLLGVEVQDTDGPVVQARDLNPTTAGDCTATNTCVAKSIGTATRVRFGRLFHQNAYGPELATIPSPSGARPFLMTAQYYAGSATGFVTNGDDNCTSLSESDLQLSNGAATIAGPGPIGVGSGMTSADIANDPLVIGNAGLWFSAPGPGGDGFVDFTFGALTPPPAWLLYDWDADGAHDDAPTGRVTFGIFRGSPRQIYRREVFQ